MTNVCSFSLVSFFFSYPRFILLSKPFPLIKSIEAANEKKKKMLYHAIFVEALNKGKIR